MSKAYREERSQVTIECPECVGIGCADCDGIGKIKVPLDWCGKNPPKELICLSCDRPESLCTCKSQPSQMFGQNAVPEVSKMLEKWKSYQDGIHAMCVHLEECLAGRIEPTNPTMKRLLDWRDKNAAVALGKLGGKVKSAAKAAAARKNGKLGGRPKKLVDRGNDAK